MIEPYRQLEILQNLASHRTPFLDMFFKGLNFFDSDYFYFLIIPVAFAVMGKKFGSRLLFMTILGGIINYFVKECFQVPRPYIIDPSIALIKVGGYSFPSGAAQGSILIAGVVYHQFKKRWLIYVLIVYVLLISFSRIYLGVHYPLDIVAGWIVGAFLLIFYFFIFLKLEKSFENLRPLYPFCIRSVFYTIPLWIKQDPVYIKLGAIAVGLSLGLMILDEIKMDTIRTKKITVNIVRSITSCLFLVFVYVLFMQLNIEKKMVKDIIMYPFLGLCASLGVVCLVNLFPYQKSKG